MLHSGRMGEFLPALTAASCDVDTGHAAVASAWGALPAALCQDAVPSERTRKAHRRPPRAQPPSCEHGWGQTARDTSVRLPRPQPALPRGLGAMRD